VEVLKDPAAGAVGMPVAMAIADGRNSALKHGTKRMPQDVRVQLQPYFDDDLLDSVRYAADTGLFNGLLQGIALHGGGAAAITLVNVIVFKGAAKAYDINTWAHELLHVKQYHDMGLAEFAATYTLDYNAIESPAYRFGKYFRQVRIANGITPELVIGHGGKCMARSSNSIGSELRLATCAPNDLLQRWAFSRNSELHLPGTKVCVHIPDGSRSNRTRPRLAQCNGDKRQRFVFTRRGELRSSLRDAFCLEVAGGFVADGTPIQMYDCNNTDSQVWINPTVKLISLPTAPQPNRCLRADETRLGSSVRLAPCMKTDPRQAWASENHGGKLRLVAVPNACLQVEGFSKAAGARLQIARCTEKRDQEFEVTMRHEMRPDVSRNTCLDLGAGATVVTAQCLNSSTQQWN
jgi:hypothetical protein